MSAGFRPAATGPERDFHGVPDSDADSPFTYGNSFRPGNGFAPMIRAAAATLIPKEDIAMRIATLPILLAGVFAPHASALSRHDKTNRFRTRDIFAFVKETSNHQFGSNKNPLFNSQVTNLFLDVFEPAGDPAPAGRS